MARLERAQHLPGAPYEHDQDLDHAGRSIPAGAAGGKQIATIDWISGGRFTLAAAVGWLKREFEMLGVSYEDRGAITDEYLRAMKVLWTQDEPEFSGSHVQFSDIVFEPKCAQSPHVPIWVAGGTGSAPVRRLIELGDGWMPMGGGLDDHLKETVVRIKDQASAAGRDPGAIAFRYTIGIGAANAELQSISQSIAVDEPAALGNDGTPESVAAEIAAFEAAGFTELAINFSASRRPRSWSSSIGSRLRSWRSYEARGGDIRDRRGDPPGGACAAGRGARVRIAVLPRAHHIPAARTSAAPRGGELPREYSHTLDPFVALMSAAGVHSRPSAGDRDLPARGARSDHHGEDGGDG